MEQVTGQATHTIRVSGTLHTVCEVRPATIEALFLVFLALHPRRLSLSSGVLVQKMRVFRPAPLAKVFDLHHLRQ